MLYLDELWWVKTPRGLGRVKIINDWTYEENPSVLVEIVDGPDKGQYKTFETNDLRTVANNTYGIPEGQF